MTLRSESKHQKREEPYRLIVALEEGREELLHVVLGKGAGKHKENKVCFETPRVYLATSAEGLMLISAFYPQMVDTY